MAQRGRSAAAGARPAVRGGARPEAGRARGRGEATHGATTHGRAAEGRGPGYDLAAIRARLRGVIEPAVASAGLDLDGLVVKPAGRRLLVQVLVDGDDGVSHDELTEIARELSARLDAAEQTGGEFTSDSYTLEVSSPGVDRPLTLPRHWRRNVGRLVKAKLGNRLVTGRVVGTDASNVTLEVDGQPLTAAFDELGPGRVQIEFNRVVEENFDDLADADDDLDDDDLGADDLGADDLEADDDDLDDVDDDLADDDLADDDELTDELDDDDPAEDDEPAGHGDMTFDRDKPHKKEDGA
jgi:ribosome maturation factor RimP